MLLAGAGLKSSARGARVLVRRGGAGVIDGPFAEAKELIAGFWMIRAASLDDAIDWARRLPYPALPEARGEVEVEVEVEIREVLTMDELVAA